MLSEKEKRAKKKKIAEKLSIRQVCKTEPNKKKGATGELELFKKIVQARKFYYASNEWQWYVEARHIEKNGAISRKHIRIEDLTPTNFSHRIPKSRGEKYRLDPRNIEIVSLAYHHYEHTGQILKVDYPN